MAMPLTDITQIVETYSDMVLRAAFSMTKNRPDAEDIAQEVFISLMRKAPTFESDEHQKAWLLRVTLNRCKDHHRSAWQRKTTALEETVAAPSTLSETENVVMEAVHALPEKYRRAVYLHYIEGYDSAEIARICGIPQNTVLSHLSRARKLLRERLKGEFDDVEK